VHAVWDCLGSRPGFFAEAMVQAGWPGSKPVALIKDVPLWVACAADDRLVTDTRSLVSALLRAGGKPVYTEYNSGGHFDGIIQGLCTPATVDWLFAQRRGAVATNEPLLSISNPTLQAVLPTGATNLKNDGGIGKAARGFCSSLSTCRLATVLRSVVLVRR
jgi:hypothetical protein